MDTVRILDQSGDTTVASEEVNSASFTNAEAVFNRLRDERHLAFVQPHGCWPRSPPPATCHNPRIP